MCICACSVKNQTSEEIRQELEQIVASLTVNKKLTSSYKRKLNSAEDSRASSRYIGYLGVVFIAVVFGSIVLIDLSKLILYLK